MATIADPWWVNKAAGFTGAIPTSGQSVPFGFTSTAGNQLYLLIAGNTELASIPSGWTMLDQATTLPTSNTDNISYILTKTSTGDSAITIAPVGFMNPFVWTIYEAPAATTVVAHSGVAAANTTFTALTGISGANVVIASLSVSMDNSKTTWSASAAWSSPWVEDQDTKTTLTTANWGGWQSVAHLTGNTVGSVTPSGTFTINVSASNSPKRDQLILALNVPAAPRTTDFFDFF